MFVVAPRVIAAPEVQLLQEGRNGTLMCSVTDGIREVEWKKENQTLVHSNNGTFDTRLSVLNSGSLYISNVTQQDGGCYSCSVSNKAGEDSKVVELVVVDETVVNRDGCVIQHQSGHEIQINSSSCFVSTKPLPFFARRPPTCIQTMEGFNVVLQCSVNKVGHLAINVTWLKDGKRLTADDDDDNDEDDEDEDDGDDKHYSLPQDGSLVISVRESDHGSMFTCSVSSGLAAAAATVWLEVLTMKQVCGIVPGESEGSGSIEEEEEEVRVRRIVEGEPSHIHNWPWQVS